MKAKLVGHVDEVHTFEIVYPFTVQDTSPDLGPVLPSQKVDHRFVFCRSLFGSSASEHSEYRCNGGKNVDLRVSYRRISISAIVISEE